VGPKIAITCTERSIPALRPARNTGVRGRLRPLLVALLACLPLAGCEVIDQRERAETESSLKVAHASGETRVPAQADRVVALSPDSLDTLLALGVKPVGAATFEDEHLPGYLAARVRGVERAGTYAKPWLAAVEFVGPNLILGQKDLQGRLFRRLDAITSTVMTEDRGHSWEVNTRLFGEALARTDAAERLLVRYDGVAARTREALHGLDGKQVSVVRVLPERVEAAGARSFAGTLLGDAGLARPPAQGEVEEDAVPVRGDGLSALDGDVILLSVAPGAEAGLAALRANPAWRRLRAVRDGEVHTMPDDPWRTGGGVLGAELCQRRLATLLGG
jgi:iron complex transport system substrate-binding protein